MNFLYFLIVTGSLDDGRILCYFRIVKTKNKHAIYEICFAVIVEFVLGAQIMMGKFVYHRQNACIISSTNWDWFK